ncbi:MAG TPA: hypothetical protein VFJ90_03700, partial [Candidatus Didemnitutus sp.]|nr:hypothetical protein [Candidatus Didemnitutus sp.]
MRTFFGFVLVTLLFSGVGKLSAKDRGPFPGAEEKWQRYESPHFELYSRNGDFSSRDLLRNLELLRAVFLDTFRLEERRPCPVTIYFFSDDSEMSPYKPEAVSKNRQLAGYYLARPDRAVIMTSEEYGTAGSRQIIFHEYIHHLYQVAEQEPPVWYNEGTAELFSTIEVSDKKLVFGRPAPGHIMELQQERLLPLETLFAVDHSSPIYNTGKHTGVFYGESWALLHYWSFGQTDLKPEKVDAFRHWALFQGAKASAAET